MKKALLLILCFAIVKISSAQLILNGTGHSENFDNIGGGLPMGWYGYTFATTASLGTDVSVSGYYSTLKNWNSTFGEFRNCASADGIPFYGSLDSAAQRNVTDRALAVRQVGQTSGPFPGSDPGAAFVLKIGDTYGITNVMLTFKLQSLDSTVSRTTTWKVDYGFGNNPGSFTAASPIGNMTTGGNTFSNNNISVDFGTLLDNQPGPVWIRIVALTATAGSGSRPTTGIDDFELTWSGIANGIEKPKINSSSLNIHAAESNKIIFDFSSEKSSVFNASVIDLAGRKILSESFSANTGMNQFSLTPQSIAPGMYLLSVTNADKFSVMKFVMK